MVQASKISDMPSGWVCGQVARDFTPTKTGRGGSMNIQESEEFKTSKFFCKTNFNMDEIKAEEADYKNHPLPVFYNFGTKENRERCLYEIYNNVNKDVDNMVQAILKQFYKEDEKTENRQNPTKNKK